MKGVLNLDLIGGTVIYIIGIIFVIQFLLFVISSYETDVEQNIMNNKARTLSQVLFTTQGVPKNWHGDLSNVNQLGLCSNFTNVCLVSNEKLNALSNIPYNTAKSILNIKDFDFRISIRNSTNAILYEYNASAVGRLSVGSQTKSLISNNSLTEVWSTVEVW